MANDADDDERMELFLNALEGGWAKLKTAGKPPAQPSEEGVVRAADPANKQDTCWGAEEAASEEQIEPEDHESESLRRQREFFQENSYK